MRILDKEDFFVVEYSPTHQDQFQKKDVRFLTNSNKLYIILPSGSDATSCNDEVKIIDPTLVTNPIAPTGTWTAVDLAEALRALTTGSDSPDVNLQQIARVNFPAHGAADQQPSVKTGGKASASTPAAVDDLDRTDAYFDLYGRLHVIDDSGGALIGGGLNDWYFDYTNSASEGLTTRTGAATFTITGTPFSLSNGGIKLIVRYDSANDFQETITPLSHVITVSGTTVTVTGMVSAADDRIYVYYKGYAKTLDIPGNQQVVTVTDQPQFHHTTQQLIEEEDEGVRNTTRYTRTTVLWGDFNKMTIHPLLTSPDANNRIRMRVWLTNFSTATLPDSSTAIVAADGFVDVSLQVIGTDGYLEALNATVTDIFLIDLPTKPYSIVLEYDYFENDTAAPDNANDTSHNLHY